MKYSSYIDGSSRGNPGPGGYGVVFLNDKEQCIEVGGYSPHTTNNRMELEAVIAAIGLAKPFMEMHEYFELCILSDSTYVVNGISIWLDSWKKNGWITSQKKPVLNDDLWKKIDDLLNNYKGLLRFSKVKGHSGDKYNERADVIATSFALGKEIDLKKEFKLI